MDAAILALLLRIVDILYFLVKTPSVIKINESSSRCNKNIWPNSLLMLKKMIRIHKLHPAINPSNIPNYIKINEKYFCRLLRMESIVTFIISLITYQGYAQQSTRLRITILILSKQNQYGHIFTQSTTCKFYILLQET